MAIFGLKAPKVIKGSSTINLDYWTWQRDEPEFNSIEHLSEIDLHREVINRGYHWVFEGVVNLFKYADPYAKLIELYTLLGDVDQLHRHRDVGPIKDSTGTAVKFICTEIQPFYLETAKFRDKVRLLFVSKDPIDITKSVTENTPLDDLDRTAVDDLGNVLGIE